MLTNIRIFNVQVLSSIRCVIPELKLLYLLPSTKIFSEVGAEIFRQIALSQEL